MAQWAGLIMLGDKMHLEKQKEFLMEQEEAFEGYLILDNSKESKDELLKILKAGDTLFIASKADFKRLKVSTIVLNELNRLGADIWFYND